LPRRGRPWETGEPGAPQRSALLFLGGESGVLVRQPGEYLGVTCECGGEWLEGLSDPGEETAVEVNHT
jgi:hypothetical protein